MFRPQNTLFYQKISKTKCDATNFRMHVQTTKKPESEISVMILAYHMKTIKQLSFDDFFQNILFFFLFQLYIGTSKKNKVEKKSDNT